MKINMFTLFKQLVARTRQRWLIAHIVKLEDKNMAYLHELGARMTVAQSLAVRMQLWKELRAVLDTYLIELKMHKHDKE